MEAELAPIAELADQYEGYICVGFPEIAEDGTLYNAAVLFDKEGTIVHRTARAETVYSRLEQRGRADSGCR